MDNSVHTQPQRGNKQPLLGRVVRVFDRLHSDWSIREQLWYDCDSGGGVERHRMVDPVHAQPQRSIVQYAANRFLYICVCLYGGWLHKYKFRLGTAGRAVERYQMDYPVYARGHRGGNNYYARCVVHLLICVYRGWVLLQCYRKRLSYCGGAVERHRMDSPIDTKPKRSAEQLLEGRVVCVIDFLHSDWRIRE
jgi:hypothetical protein